MQPSSVLAVLAAATLFSLGTSAGSQAVQVSVDLTDVASDLAQRLHLDESRMPMSILVPREVAAEACGVAVQSLVTHPAGQGQGCMARGTSATLDRILLARLRSDESPPTGSPGSKKD
jgi:hypothetical protein